MIDAPDLRPTGARFWPGWDAKTHESLQKKPFYRRAWFVRSALALGVGLVLAATVAAVFFVRWRREQLAEIERQRRGVLAFVASRDFALFARTTDAQFVALLNFISARPGPAQPLLPAVAAWDREHHALPWTFAVPPLPVSAATDPRRVASAMRALADELARRGFAFDAPSRSAARQLFLRLLAPHAQAFATAFPEKDFPLLRLDARMQETALAAYAAHTGTGAGVADLERSFAVYQALGPELWRAIEAGTGRR